MAYKTRGLSASSITPFTFYSRTSGTESGALASGTDFDADSRWGERSDDLHRLLSLPDDWDGQGAVAPESLLVNSAIDLLRKFREQTELPPPTRIVAAPSGSVVLEWQTGEVYLEAEVFEPDHVDWMLERPAQPTEHWSMP